jgi:uncharacterized cupin superfamily protein
MMGHAATPLVDGDPQEREDGSVQTFVAGDSFTMEAGWAGEWRVDQPFMKYFALSTPPG